MVSSCFMILKEAMCLEGTQDTRLRDLLGAGPIQISHGTGAMAW